MHGEYLKVSQVARELSISVSAVYLLIEKGKLRAFNLGDVRCVRVARSDLREFVESRDRTKKGEGT
jgi:excisionase family DNA binding protein